MKIRKANPESDERCETCRYFIQHYVKVPFINMDYGEANDGYCIQKRRKNVRTDRICEEYAAHIKAPDRTN